MTSPTRHRTTPRSAAVTAAGVARAQARRARAGLDDLLLPTIVAGPAAGTALSLTFDDGPTPGLTDRISDRLAQQGHRASFFVLAPQAAQHPDLVRRLLAAGHEVGLHGVQHRPLTEVPFTAVRSEVQQGARMLSTLGVDVRWFRPPKGAQSRTTFLAVRSLGLRVVGWSADVQDYRDDPEHDFLDRVDAAIRPGAIVLQHDGEGDDPASLDEQARVRRLAGVDRTLALMRDRGLRSVPVGELIAMGARQRCWLQ